MSTLFSNTSGKRIQHPNRLSEAFNWGKNEVVKILYETNEEGNQGYVLESCDYVYTGNGSSTDLHRFETNNPEMRGWIGKKQFEENFTEIK